VRLPEALARKLEDVGYSSLLVPDHFDDQVAPRLVDRQPGADRRSRRLLDQVDLAGSGLHRRVAHRALLHLGDPGGDPDHDPGPVEAEVALVPRGDLAGLGDEVLQHPLGDVEVGDDPVFQGPDDDDVLGRATQHRLGLVPDPDHRLIRRSDRHDGRLMEDDALAPDENERVGSTQVDREVGREHTEKLIGEHPVTRQQDLGQTPKPAIRKRGASPVQCQKIVR